MKFKKIKYKITNPFGLREEGEIIDAYLIVNENPSLVYHPRSKRECSSFELCCKDGKEYVSLNEESFVNVNNKNKELEQFLLKDSK